MKANDWQPFIAEWRDVPAGVINAAQQRLWVALGNRAGEVAYRINTDQTFVQTLARLAIRHYLRAREAQFATKEKQTLVTYKVADCFAKSLFYYRDGDLDAWLPATLPVLPAGNPKCLVTAGSETFRQVAERELCVSGKSNEELMKLLVEKQKCFSLKQIEVAVARHQTGNKSFGLLDNGSANFFFVEGEGGSVFVVNVSLSSDGWRARVDRFGDGRVWSAGRRVFFRN